MRNDDVLVIGDLVLLGVSEQTYPKNAVIAHLQGESAMKPTVGRIVHLFLAPDTAPIAALVVGVNAEAETVNVAAFPDCYNPAGRGSCDRFVDLPQRIPLPVDVTALPDDEVTDLAAGKIPAQAFPCWDWPERA